ncbi:MAG TPA: hypothetical protein V6C84_18240 [Coleofasciculaceae cyanobacterium]
MTKRLQTDMATPLEPSELPEERYSQSGLNAAAIVYPTSRVTTLYFIST